MEELTTRFKKDIKESLDELWACDTKTAHDEIQHKIDEQLNHYRESYQVANDCETNVRALWPSMTFIQKLQWHWYDKINKQKARRARAQHEEFYRDFEGQVPSINPIFEKYPTSVMLVDIVFKPVQPLEFINLNFTLEKE